MKHKCPLCGSHRLKTADGADGNPYHKNRSEKTVCLDCGWNSSSIASEKKLILTEILRKEGEHPETSDRFKIDIQSE